MSTIRKCDYCGKAMSDHETRVAVRTPELGTKGYAHLCVWPDTPSAHFWDACLECHIKLLEEARDARKAVAKTIAEGDVAKDKTACEVLSDSHKTTLSEHPP